MSAFYNNITKQNRGAWVVHHGQKTTATTNASAEFPALDTAGKAASLLSQLSATEQSVVEKQRLEGLAKSAGLNPYTELPSLVDILARQRLIDKSANGGVEVLGLSSRVTTQHAADIFDAQSPSPEEQASIALAELTSNAPVKQAPIAEFISDEFKLTRNATADLIRQSEAVGFVDAEGNGADKLYFNGNIFRRDNVAKTNRVLNSLSEPERTKFLELDGQLAVRGCMSIAEAEAVLGTALLDKLKAAGMYDVNIVANPLGDHCFITRPAAFHKFNDPLTDDAFDLAKMLVSALMYGMSQSSNQRGRIFDVVALLDRLISGSTIGPATAIGEDYRVLEHKGVLRVTKAAPFGFHMRLVKRDIGEMAKAVLTTGDSSTSNIIERPLPGRMEGYSGPEKSRADFRKTQMPASKRWTLDVLHALRTGEL